MKAKPEIRSSEVRKKPTFRQPSVILPVRWEDSKEVFGPCVIRFLIAGLNSGLGFQTSDLKIC